MHHEILATTPEKRPIEMFRLTQGPVPLLLMAGVHGDEPEGFYLIERFMKEGAWRELQGMASLYVIPRLNPDGCAVEKRTNSQGVDLNRNMPTKDWTSEARAPRYFPGNTAGSELETKILIEVIERIKPHVIISAHSWEPCINYNGPCKKLAEVMAKYNQYKVLDHIGYPTPGSLGTWSGWERNISIITLEIEREAPLETVWKLHNEALMAALLFSASNEKLE